MGLIQTPDQLYFSYKAILEGIKYLKENVSFVRIFLETKLFFLKSEKFLAQRFHSLEDEPLISNEDFSFMDPDDPPVIPQRTQSLHPHSGLIPFETLPTSNNTSKLNNNDASQQQQHVENHLANRPLPELPKSTNSSSDADDSSSSGEEEIIRSINTSEEEDDDDNVRDASEMDADELEKDPDNPHREVNGNANDEEG